MIKKASIPDLQDIVNLLKHHDNEFTPALSDRININHFVSKVLENGEIFKYQDKEGIKGVIFIYMNDLETFVSFLSLILVAKEYRKGKENVGKKLMEFWIERAKYKKFRELRLEVSVEKQGLVEWYKSYGFKPIVKSPRGNYESYVMQKLL
jgi:ribosomal protein S18 acetylase RimI-like enzyme